MRRIPVVYYSRTGQPRAGGLVAALSADIDQLYDTRDRGGGYERCAREASTKRTVPSCRCPTIPQVMTSPCAPGLGGRCGRLRENVSSNSAEKCAKRARASLEV